MDIRGLLGLWAFTDGTARLAGYLGVD
jgi:hypothetical protein